MDKSEKLILAVDLGGTKMRAALVKGNGEILQVINRKTSAEKGVKDLLDRLVNSLNEILAQNNIDRGVIDSISIAIAGAVDVNRGVLTASPNLSGWVNIPLKQIINDTTGIKTHIENDVNAAAIGEYYFGNAGNVKHFVFIAVGTGIGGGIFIDGKLYGGFDGSAGEIGHMIIKENGPKCGCGNRGCLEALCSGTAIEREIRTLIRKKNLAKWVDFNENNIELITARDVGEAAQNGDELAKKVIDKAAYYLGIGMGNIINIVNPQMIISGGGVSRMGDILIKPAIETALNIAFELPGNTVRMVPSSLGHNAGILGAAALAHYNS